MSVGTAIYNRRQDYYLQQNSSNSDNDQYYIEHKYSRSSTLYRNKGDYCNRSKFRNYNYNKDRNYNRNKRDRSDNCRDNRKGYIDSQKCYVYSEAGCWSTKHIKEERASLYNKFRKESYFANSKLKAMPKTFQQFLLQWEGQPPLDDFAQSLIQIDIWYTIIVYADFNRLKVIILLCDKAIQHALTRDFQKNDVDTYIANIFLYNQYSNEVF